MDTTSKESSNTPLPQDTTRGDGVHTPVYIPTFLQPEHVAPGVIPKAPDITVPVKNTTGPKGPLVMMGCFGFFALLFIIFVGVLIIGYNTNSSIFATLGLTAVDMERLLRLLLTVSFSLFSGVALVVGVINVFRLLLAKKDEKAQKKQSVWAIFISFGVMLVGLLFWALLSNAIKVSTPIAQNNSVIQLEYKNEATGEFEPLPATIDLEAPMEVRFTVSDAILPSETEFWRVKKYQWDLDGDGQFTQQEGNARSVMYRYTSKGFNAGLYDVKMQATIEFLQPYQGKKAGEILEQVYGPGSQNGGVSLTFTKLRPTLKILTSPDILSGPVPFKVDFDGSNTFVGADITSMQWDMDNDGNFESSGKKQSKTFDKVGQYKVIVKAINAEGATSTQLFQIEALDAAQMKVQITANPTEGSTPLRVQFAGEVSTLGGRAATYQWDFGDGSEKIEGKTTNHTFTKAGSYTVTLEVTTDTGVRAQATQTITVETAKSTPTSKIKATIDGKVQGETVAISGNIPLTVKLDGSYSTDPEGDIVDWQWDVDGDKKFDLTGKEVSYTYKTPGNYVLVLQVTDSAGNISETKKNVEVGAKSISGALSAQPLSGEAPLLVSFDASGSSTANGSIASYTWDFGDGTAPQITGAQIAHEFTVPGNYIVKVSARSTSGEKVESTQTISVLEEQLLPAFTMSPGSGKAPATISFDARLSKGKIMSYRWDFGDGEVATEIAPTHTYHRPGTFDVILRVQDRNGNLQTARKTITIE